MKGLRLIPATVLVAGLATTAGALLWWGATYWQVWFYEYLSLPQASRCLVADSTICRLAAALCTGQHRALVSVYSPLALWTGATLLACGVSVAPALRRTPDHTHP